MFKLSQKTDYGLILLSNLARSNSLVSLSTIARKHKISPKFLSQVAQDLKKAGLVKAKEGVLGGYKLAKKPDQIKLANVLVVLDGEIVSGKCFEGDHECECGAKDVWTEMKIKINESLNNKTIADLIA